MKKQTRTKKQLKGTRLIATTIPADLAQLLRDRAQKEDRPLSRVVRQLLEQGLKTDSSNGGRVMG